jgi:LCP family protein required for cell wall assembly
MRLSVLLKLALVLVGCAVLGGVGWRLLASTPFEAAPPLSPARRAAAGSVAAAVQPAESDLPAPMSFTVDRIETPPLRDTVNILLAGVDTRPEKFGGRTDALVLVVLDRRTGHVGLIGIPRDLLVNTTTDEAVRINTIYARGTREGGPASGSALLRRVIRDVVGLPVQHVVFVDHAGFERMIDSAGGVPVRVICPIRDRFIDPRGPGGHRDLDLTPGVHWMDGKTALMFARSRHGRGITDRARRQQAVLLGLRDRLAALGPGGARRLLPQLQRTVYTDLRAVDLIGLLPWINRVQRRHVHGLVLHWKHTTPRVMDDGRWVMIPRIDVIEADVRNLFRAGTPGFRRPTTCKPVNAAFEHRRQRDAMEQAKKKRRPLADRPRSR